MIRVTSFPFLLFAVFFVLRVNGQIVWSWWWITSPLWIGQSFSIFAFWMARRIERGE